ncbi:MAG: heparinase II/III family protein, partial [Armatimonadetes bacterium]|nr:heparinase II/III family protein [Armatimonadota bacterium]
AAPSQGLVGFLHYYNYGYRYENIDLMPLDAKLLPAPGKAEATVGPSGVVKLRWKTPPALEGLLTYRIYRSEGSRCEVTRPNQAGVSDGELCEFEGHQFTDRRTRTGAVYTYRVTARAGDQEEGPASVPMTIRLGRARPPLPPIRVGATKRVDGSVRLRWRLPPDSRADSVRILMSSSALTARSLRSATVVAPGLPVDQTTFLTAPGSLNHFAVVVQDPDGKQPAWAAVESRPSAPEVKPKSSWPTKHPMLMYDWTQVEAARRKIATDESARKLAQQTCYQADALIKSPPNAPKEPVDDHPLIGRLVPVGQAYVLSGDDKYAKWVRDVMRSYAAVYPTWPVAGSGRARMVKTASGLYEAVKYVPIILAYDMTYDSPAYSKEDHAAIESDFLRPAVDLFWVKDYASKADYRPSDLHYKCYNFQAWFDACIGLTGLLLRDADMVEHAIDGPYGFKHLLAHDLHDDGIFWERSLGYHNFVLSALYPLLEGAYHCNLDLWHLTVPDDYNKDREPSANYCVGDGDHGPKSIKLMFDSQFYFGYGDLSYAQIADSDRGPLRASDLYRTAWVRYGDPKYAWLINRNVEARPPGALHQGDADASGDIALAFDEENLYLAAKITDNVVNNSHQDPSEVWMGDALWFGIKWRSEPGGPYDFIYGLSPGDFKNVPPVPALFNRFIAPHNGGSKGKFSVNRTRDGYTIEAAIPISEMTPEADEKGAAFRPKTGDKAVVDFVIYDCDAATGSSSKEKMVSWSCTTDRYDSSQGGMVLFGGGSGEGKRVVAVAMEGKAAGKALAVDGDLSDWGTVGSTWAQIRKGAAVTTDSSSSGPGLHSLFHAEPKPGEGAFDLKGKSFCNNGVLQAGCSLFPSTGFALLRERLDDQGRVPLEATCATLNFGPYGGGHGHPDKLSLVLYAGGKQWIPDFGSCGYDSVEKGTWTAQTISHNTIVVDGVSQYPTGEGNPTWPCDTSDRQARAYLDFFHCDELMKSAGAHCDSVYPGVHLSRTVCLVGDTLFDFYQVKSEASHQYDYTLHIDGSLLESSTTLSPRDGTLGEKCGYQHVDRVREGIMDTPIITTWGDDSKKLRLTGRAAKGTTVLVGEGLTNSLTGKMPMLILRRQGKDTLFAVAAQPFTQGTPSVVQWIDTGKDEVAAATMAEGDSQVLVVFNGSGKPVTVEGFQVKGRLGVRRVKGGRTIASAEAD